MVTEIYSLGGYYFYSAKELAEFKIQEPEYWESIKHLPLKKRGILIENYNEFVDYLDSLDKKPDICLTYHFDNARGYGLYTTLWCNSLEILGIFRYLESNNTKDHLVYDMIALSKWKGLKIRTNYCR